MAREHTQFAAALFHLRMDWDSSSVPEFEARVLQGDREIPQASDSAVAAFLAGPPPEGNLPVGFERQMLDMLFATSPLETKLAWHGIVLFGARQNGDAARCAYEVLQSNQGCRLARQLLSLILTKTDVRKPFGVDASQAPDVVGIVRREVDTL